MIVFYRITSIPSTNPSPWGKSKEELNEVCLKSFLAAFWEVKPVMYFIADHCDESVNRMIERLVPFPFHIQNTYIGINETMRRSYDLASLEDEYVLFQECDYLYRPGIGKSYLKALETLDIVSPYDHRNFYMDKTIHSSTCEIALIGEQHYRSVERNTMTWGTHSRVVKDNLEMLKSHGYLDDQVWSDLMLSGHQLWVPILSFATHCVKDYLAPGINWESLWQKYA